MTVAVSGVGNWLALNQLAGDAVQRPYVGVGRTGGRRDPPPPVP
ncbi:protein of unknown function [Blastococcus saxobsidens DD2]|uniref:Uncharacterized protein n=1 Tax=Blastococcus saxobsidens (strain DD2) TaxID=1146883 RepID=H6RR40_BLASD|nr:protein of unknown function [Blastococcus saxobsidens DD2]